MINPKTFEEDFKSLLALNCSTLFLLKPIVGMGISKMSGDFGMLNTFLEDETNDTFQGDFLFVLLKPSELTILEILIAQQEADNLNFVGEYDYPNGYVVLVYSIPKDMKPDFQLFKEGKYSKMSSKFKEQHDKTIKRGILGKEEKSFQFLVFTKDEEFREALNDYLGISLTKNDELWSTPNPSKEILKISNYGTIPPTTSITEDAKSS